MRADAENEMELSPIRRVKYIGFPSVHWEEVEEEDLPTFIKIMGLSISISAPFIGLVMCIQLC